MVDIDALQPQLEKIIRSAGDILLGYFHLDLSRVQKEHGFVTQADIASEEFLKKRLHELLPQAAIIAEESGLQGKDGEYCWVVDPLDGTTNFAHGLPYFCISIALTYQGIPLLGMIYQPLLQELFYAATGKGAYLNGSKISVSQSPFEQSFIFIGFPYAKGESFLSVLRHLQSITPRTYAFRHLGAIALDLAYVACGRADGIFFEELAWWDVAAGIVLIQEAGGIVTTFQNGPVRKGYRSCVAGNKRIHGSLRVLLEKNQGIFTS